MTALLPFFVTSHCADTFSLSGASEWIFLTEIGRYDKTTVRVQAEKVQVTLVLVKRSNLKASCFWHVWIVLAHNCRSMVCLIIWPVHTSLNFCIFAWITESSAVFLLNCQLNLLIIAWIIELPLEPLKYLLNFLIISLNCWLTDSN